MIRGLKDRDDEGTTAMVTAAMAPQNLQPTGLPPQQNTSACHRSQSPPYCDVEEAMSYWKRGSLRSGSNIGSSQSKAGVSGGRTREVSAARVARFHIQECGDPLPRQSRQWVVPGVLAPEAGRKHELICEIARLSNAVVCHELHDSGRLIRL